MKFSWLSARQSAVLFPPFAAGVRSNPCAAKRGLRVPDDNLLRPERGATLVRNEKTEEYERHTEESSHNFLDSRLQKGI